MEQSTTALIIAKITEVFSEVMGWIVEAINSVVAVFWTGEALTFLGVLSIVALSISVFFLLMGKFLAPLVSNNQMKTPLTAGIEKNQQPSPSLGKAQRLSKV